VRLALQSAIAGAVMKKLIATLGLLVSATGFASAFETAQSVTATPITAVPFVISVPGNYFLPADLSFSGAGVAIVIEANEVVLDLNGRSLKATGAAASPNVGIGIAVLNHEDVVIQNGDINKFGAFGILLDATDGVKEHNQKNRVQRVNFNADQVGVQVVSGSIDVVEDCDFDGGSVGIVDIASLGGDRFQKDNFENQQPVEAFNAGFGVLALPGKGVLVEDCMFASIKVAGLILQGAQDKFRFDTFVSDGATHLGGTEEGSNDL
jgi:hypothetical protein